MVTKRKPPKQNSEQGAPAKPARPSVKGKTVARGQVRPEAETKANAASSAGAGPSARKASAGANASGQRGSAEGVAAQPAKPAKPKRRIAMPQSSTRLKQNQAANGSAQGAGVNAPSSPDAAVSVAAGKTAGRAGKPTKARKPLAMPSSKEGAPDGKASHVGTPDPEGASRVELSTRFGKSPKARGHAGARENQADIQDASRRSKARSPKRFSVAKADKAAADQAKELDSKVSAADAASAEDAARTSLAADAAKRRLERRQRKLAHQEEAGSDAGENVSSETSGPSKRKAFSTGIGFANRSRANGSDVPASDDEAVLADADDANDAAPRKRKAPAFHISWPVGVALAVLAIIVVAVSVFSWGRWLRYDDAADFQGAWYANGTTSIVTVDGEKIYLTDDVAYNYTLDTGAKTITFTFGQMEGHGRYRFSVDRSELVITDGNDFSFWGNLFSDVAWQFDQAVRNMQGQEIEREAAVDGVTVLDRTQSQGAVSAVQDSQKASEPSGDEAGADDPDATTDGELASDSANGETGTDEDSADVSAGESQGSANAGQQGADNSTGNSFQGAVAEGGIDSAGSNAVTLEQLKSGSL